MKQLILLVLSTLLAPLCCGDITPGSLESDAATLEAQHGMLAQERRLARIAIIQAHRTPRTAIFTAVRRTGEALRRLPASNVPVHEQMYSLTKNVHTFIDEKVNELEKEQNVQIHNALFDIDSKAQVVVEQFPALAVKSMKIFSDGVSEAILPDTDTGKLEGFEAQRAAKLDAIIGALKSLAPPEAIEKFRESIYQEVTALFTEDSPKLYNPNWSDSYSRSVTQEQVEREPLYDMLMKELLDITRTVVRDMNNKVRNKEGYWQEEVHRLHQSGNMTLDSEPLNLSDLSNIDDVIRDTVRYDSNHSLPSLMQTIIDLLESVLSYLEFVYPFLRQNNLLALALLSLGLVIVSALLLSPPVLFLRCKWQQYLAQQKRYELYRARAARHCAYTL